MNPSILQERNRFQKIQVMNARLFVYAFVRIHDLVFAERPMFSDRPQKP